MLLFVFLFGLVIGSFISALAWRWPRGISIAKGRSFCPKCKKQIAWFDNIPVISYILLSGKCRNCKKKIAIRYPLIELVLGLGFVTIFLTLGYSLYALLISLLFCVLLTMAVIDLEHRVIPDEISLGSVAVLFVLLLLFSGDSFYVTLTCGFFSSLFLLSLNRITKGRGMGLGDVKLAIAGGMLLGFPGSIIWLCVAFVVGAIVGILLIALNKAKLGSKIPFGPFLAFSLIVSLLWGNLIINALFYK